MAICAQYQSTQDTQWEAPLKDFNNQAPGINPLVAMPWLFTSKYVQQCLASITWMFFSNAQSKCTIVSSCRACYYFHHSSPRWFTKSLNIVVSFQPAGKHF